MEETALSTVEALAHQAFTVWESAKQTAPEVVVEPSVPILYFGDMDAYLASPIRVATVALNPSRVEFPTEDPFKRFPQAQGTNDMRSYLSALNAYFKTDPYRGWFASFEPILNGIGASYYSGEEITAVHTDLCSPVATDPTWSRLDKSTKRELIGPGVQLWHDLIRLVRPDVLLISVARRHLDKIEFARASEAAELHRLEDKRVRPYITQTWEVQIHDDARARVVFGRAANQPFGLVSNQYKRLLGRLLAESLER